MITHPKAPVCLRADGRRNTLVATLVALAISAGAHAGNWQVAGTVSYADGSPAAGASVVLTAPSGASASTVANAAGGYALALQSKSSDDTETAQLAAFIGSCQSGPVSLREQDILRDLLMPGGSQECTQ